MVDKDTVIEKISVLKKHLARLRQIGKYPKSAFLNSEDLQQLAAFNLQTAVQNCIDVGSHIFSELDLGTPGTYNEIFYVLVERKVITKPMLAKLVQMIGLRNRIAHDYEDISNDKIYSILKRNLSDFELFIKQIVKYLKL
jgi:uncharacterized protein YutE (UPF0331/DUF86 family)